MGNRNWTSLWLNYKINTLDLDFSFKYASIFQNLTQIRCYQLSPKNTVFIQKARYKVSKLILINLNETIWRWRTEYWHSWWGVCQALKSFNEAFRYFSSLYIVMSYHCTMPIIIMHPALGERSEAGRGAFYFSAYSDSYQVTTGWTV